MQYYVYVLTELFGLCVAFSQVLTDENAEDHPGSGIKEAKNSEIRTNSRTY